MADVIVIGGGAMGSSTAWWLARRGVDVVLLERFPAGHRRGSSHGVSRIFRLAYPDPSYVELAKEAHALWRELEADAGETLLEPTGSLDHGDQRWVQAVAGAFEQSGVRHEWLAPEAAAERWPAMAFEGDVLFQPDGGRCLADRTVAALQRRTKELGGDVRTGVGRARVRVAGDGDGARVDVDIGDETLTAPVAVVTAGAWVADVVEGTAAASALPPLKVTQEQVQHFVPADGDLTSEWPAFIHYRSVPVYGLRTPDEGVKIALHHAGAVVDPDDRPPRDALLERTVVDYVEQWFPGLDPTPVNTVECLYTTTPDESFVLERVGPIVVGSACSGHGFKFTPAIGRRLADLATG